MACTARYGPSGIPGLSGRTLQFRESSSGDWQNTKSLMVICENYDGGFYYKGLGLGDGHSVEVDNFVRAEDEFTASNSGVQCRVSPAALIVTRGPATIINEPMLEYWSV